jgi:signal transduction histidine kinase
MAPNDPSSYLFTTKPPGHGTGLGLSTSHAIVVDKHGGAIRVESRPNRTRFEVWLLLDQAPVAPDRIT